MVRYSPKTLYLLLLAILLLAQPCPVMAEFRVLKPGFETGGIKVQSGIFASELAIVRVDPKLWSLRVYKSSEPKTAQEVSTATNSDAVINANFFGTDLKPLGLIIADSKLQHPLQLGGKTLTGVFFRDRNQSKIVFRDKFKVSNEITEAIQAGPRLISEGQSISIPQDSSTRRSAIAIDRKGRILLFASKDRFPGLSLVELQEILLRKELEIQDALNLDGGGSSQLYVSSQNPGNKIDVSGGDKVPVFLIVKEIK